MSREYALVPDHVLLLHRDEWLANFNNMRTVFYVTRDRMNRLLREAYERRSMKHWAVLVFRGHSPSSPESLRHSNCVINGWVDEPTGDHRICYYSREDGVNLFGSINDVIGMKFCVEGDWDFVLRTPPVRWPAKPRDDAALIGAIAANPEEETPRLVYADWLDENGRPERAEFIRITQERKVADHLPRVRELLSTAASSLMGPASVRAAQHYQTEKGCGPYWDCGWLHTAVLGDWHTVPSHDGSLYCGSCRNLKLVRKLAAEQPCVRCLWVNYDDNFMYVPVLDAVYEGGMRAVSTIHLRHPFGSPWPVTIIHRLVDRLLSFDRLTQVHCSTPLGRHIRAELATREGGDRIGVIGHRNY